MILILPAHLFLVSFDLDDWLLGTNPRKIDPIRISWEAEAEVC
jgi:hypothetical protein